MNHMTIETITPALLDISKFETTYTNGMISLVDKDLLQQIYTLITTKCGYAVCYNTCKIMLRHGLDIKSSNHAEIARQFLENIFRLTAAQIDLSRYSPIDAVYDQIVKMDVDGFHINKAHTPNSQHTAAREFVTTKCVHFDAATPFLANIYGPNKNIDRGHPIICNTKQYCLDNKIDPFDLIESIPNHYNVVVKSDYYQEILDNYSFALDIDLTNDLVMIVLHNEVNGGVAHAATQPIQIVENQETIRPIRHIEFQFNNADDLAKWYDRYKLTLAPAGNSNHKTAASNLDYNNRSQKPFSNFIKVNNVV